MCMKIDIADFVAKYPNCQQVKALNQRPGGVTHNIDIHTLKWKDINMYFVVGFPPTIEVNMT